MAAAKKPFYKKKRTLFLVLSLAAAVYFFYPFIQNPLGHFQKSVSQVLSLFGIEEKNQWVKRSFFHYWEGGKKSEEKNSLVLVHGFGGNALWTWMRLMPSLQKERHLLALDLLASRFWRLKASQYSVQAEVDHVLKFLEAQKLKKVDLVGLSVGGWVALKIAREHPDKVGRLILIESAGLTTKVPDFARLTLDNRKKARAFMRQLFYRPPPVPDFALDELVKSSKRIKDAYLKVLDAFIKSSASQVLDHQLGEIKQETLILHGRQDQVVPLEHAKRLHQGLPNAELKVLEACGHAAVWDAHYALKESILDFIKKP